MCFTNYKLSDLPFIAQKIIEKTPYKIVLFEGEMGVGKTTLIKCLAKQLGVVDEVSSPTYSIVNEYQTTNGLPVFHFDFYRIDDPNELYEIGIENYFQQKNAWCFVEWAARAKDFIPEESILLKIIENVNGSRSLTFEKN